MAVKAITSLARIMKSADMGKITKLGKVISNEGGTLVREATFANGRVGQFAVTRTGGLKNISVWDGHSTVNFRTHGLSKNQYSLCEAYSKAKGGYVELFPKNYSWDIKRGNQYIASGNSTVTPINVKNKIVNGKLKQTVLSNQEIHTSVKYTSDNGFGHIIENKDVLLNSQNKLMAIYQRPNTYYPASQTSLGKDLSKGPVWANPTGYKTKYTGQTPIETLNNDLNAGFKSQVNPIWSKLEEMFWRIS